MQKINKSHFKKGDTIIEVTIAFAIFSLVAIITVAMMNVGIATSERSLELVTARSEINAQAEAIRFIYNSYVSEHKLPKCDEVTEPYQPCQKYAKLWEKIADEYAIDSGEYQSINAFHDLKTCNEVYQPDGGSRSPLQRANAFIINARKLAPNGIAEEVTTEAVVSINSDPNTFESTPLSSRILYTDGGATSDEQMASRELTDYIDIAKVQGLWVVAVKGNDIGGKIPFYDFYIRSCWYGSNSPTYSSLDSVIRLYKSW